MDQPRRVTEARPSRLSCGLPQSYLRGPTPRPPPANHEGSWLPWMPLVRHAACWPCAASPAGLQAPPTCRLASQAALCPQARHNPGPQKALVQCAPKGCWKQTRHLHCPHCRPNNAGSGQSREGLRGRPAGRKSNEPPKHLFQGSMLSQKGPLWERGRHCPEEPCPVLPSRSRDVGGREEVRAGAHGALAQGQHLADLHQAGRTQSSVSFCVSNTFILQTWGPRLGELA